ncbi:MAG: replicative DNA helicase [Planctomycetaceae bacterium]|jgi:replicative DNA helicase|nr:replicative DNA helicase [Planctomycetaceae bacterium]
MAKTIKRKIDPPKQQQELNMFDRLPPNNLEAERGVIGAILLDPHVSDDVSTIVRPSDFYSEANRKIYGHLLEMHSSGGGIDLTLLVEHLKSAGEFENVGGEAYIGELMSAVYVTAHTEHYAKIVRDKAILRELIHTTASILHDAYEPEYTPRELVSRAEERIFAINNARASNQVYAIHDVLMETFRLIDARMEHGGADGVSTGFTDLDDMTGGFHPSELLILAARPSMGKTAFATNIADHVAVDLKVPTVIFSLEMGRIELAQRMLCCRGRIDAHKLRGNYLSAAERQALTRASSEMDNSPLAINDSPSLTVTEISAIARRMKRQQGLGLIVIDYLGLIEPDNSYDPRQEQVAKIARRLKGLARELEVPVLCLAQLNRMAETMKDNRPRLSHLRESGAIEQDADVVMFVHREEYYHKKEEAEEMGIVGQAEIMIAKQRNGPVGDIKLQWQGEYTLFNNLAKDTDGYDEFTSFSGGDDFYDTGTGSF